MKSSDCAIACVRLYRMLLSPFLAPACRFHPSCSHYAEEALQRYGIIKGLYLAVRRLARCHPFHPGGYDPVPDDSQEQGQRSADQQLR